MTIGEAVGRTEVVPQTITTHLNGSATSEEIDDLFDEDRKRASLEGKAIEKFSPYYPLETLKRVVRRLSISNLETITDPNWGEGKVSQYWQYAFSFNDDQGNLIKSELSW
tara:strand:+ start:52 stop:381 length:330 start_codon:yes stop_codon:yes gene_type:complete